MKKRWISLLLVFAMVAALMPQVAIKVRAVQSGTCGDNLTWVLDDEGTLTISGTGRMADYGTAAPAPWNHLKDNIKYVIIEPGVTSIGDRAFFNYPNLSGVELPDTLQGFGSDAFYSTGITSLTIPDGMTRIGRGVFSNCTKLKEVFLPESLTYIGLCSFYACTSLETIEIPKNVKTIDIQAFFSCDSLTSITIPDSVISIGNAAFADCMNLQYAEIGCGLKTMDVTDSTVFCGCAKLTEIIVDPRNEYFSSQDGVLFTKDMTQLIQYPSGKTTVEYKIPDGVQAIGFRSFLRNPYLERVTVSDSVTEIDAGAFMYCSKLNTITLPSTIVEIAHDTFLECRNLSSITIPDSVTHIGGSAFRDCSGLKYIFFQGDAPIMGSVPFYGVISNAYYPLDNKTWTADAMQNYGGKITWVPYNPRNPFTDVSADSFYYDPVLWAVENNITTGTTAITFNPTGDCLRAQVVTFLWRAAGEPKPTSTHNPFVDVKPSDFYYDAVLWAVENGITNGADATHFNPMGMCNRAQVVTFLYRAFESPAVENTPNPFTDVPAGTWYTIPVLWAVENGITNGLSATQFGPDTSCNRAQIVTFLYRAYN